MIQNSSSSALNLDTMRNTEEEEEEEEEEEWNRVQHAPISEFAWWFNQYSALIKRIKDND